MWADSLVLSWLLLHRFNVFLWMLKGNCYDSAYSCPCSQINYSDSGIFHGFVTLPLSYKHKRLWHICGATCKVLISISISHFVVILRLWTLTSVQKCGQLSLPYKGGEILFFFFFFFFRASPTAHGNSQARGRIGATVAGLHHRHSNKGSKPSLQPTP